MHKGNYTITVVLRDITIRKQAEEVLLWVQEDLEQKVRERTEKLAQANLALESSEARFRSVVQSAGEAIITVNHRGQIVSWNRKATTIFGFTEAEAVGQNLHIIMPEPFRTVEHGERMSAIGNAGSVTVNRTMETVGLHKNGTEFPIELSISTWRIGDEIYFTGIIQDITERKRAEQVLQSARDELEQRVQERTRELGAANKELMAVSQAERNQRRFAEALARAAINLNTSLHLDEVLDRILEQIHLNVPCRAVDISLLHDGYVTIARHRGLEKFSPLADLQDRRMPLNLFPMLEMMNEHAHPVLIEDTLTSEVWRSPDGLEWVRSFAATPLKIEQEIIGFLNLYNEKPGFFDPQVTDRLNAFAAHAVVAIKNANLYHELELMLDQEQTMRNQLVQSEKFVAMGRMLASVAHELNNPLQTIMNCLFLAQNAIPAEDGAQEYLEISTTEIQRLSTLVAHLRELYRPKIDATMQSLSLRKVIDEIHVLVTPYLQRHRVKWRQQNVDPSLKILGVEDRLKQVFLNITLNAIEAMSETGGQLSIRAVSRPELNQVGIAIEDTGPGISPEDLSRLFEPFYTTKSSGTGLGLSISHEIVRNHGGQINVSSEIDAGTTFTVWLPWAQPVATENQSRK